MNRLVQWVLYLILLSAYLWAVFVWDRFPSAPKQVPEFTQVPEAAPDTAVVHTVPEAEQDPFAIVDSATLQEFADPVPEQSLPEEPFIVIGGSFESYERAEREKARLEGLYIPAEILFIDPYYRIVLGTHSSRQRAQSMVLDMRALGVDAFIQENP